MLRMFLITLDLGSRYPAVAIAAAFIVTAKENVGGTTKQTVAIVELNFGNSRLFVSTEFVEHFSSVQIEVKKCYVLFWTKLHMLVTEVYRIDQPLPTITHVEKAFGIFTVSIFTDLLYFKSVTGARCHTVNSVNLVMQPYRNKTIT